MVISGHTKASGAGILRQAPQSWGVYDMGFVNAYSGMVQERSKQKGSGRGMERSEICLLV